MNGVAAMKCGAAVVGAALLGVAAEELLRYATGQAIVAGAPLPALAVALMLAAACWAVTKLGPEA